MCIALIHPPSSPEKLVVRGGSVDEDPGGSLRLGNVDKQWANFLSSCVT